jgi:divinyl protochlorophyllide a 8-vinyl-reductase
MGPEQALIGPNAVIQLAIALRSAGLGHVARDIFAEAAAEEWLERPPTAMVDEIRVARIHQALREKLTNRKAKAVLTAAGELTADYLLAHRIPKAFKWLLSWLPIRVGERLFLVAIRRHAWTFVGSGKFEARVGTPTILEITGNPFCEREKRTEPVCDWHAAVFQRLFAEVISPSAHVREVACEARGDACCRFALCWLQQQAPVDTFRGGRATPQSGSSKPAASEGMRTTNARRIS